MGNIKELQNRCAIFRDLEMRIWGDGDCVMMKIPLILDDGFGLVIKTRFVQKNGMSMICISDDGCIARHNPVNLADIRVLCLRYGLRYSIIGDRKAVPLDCEIYRIVEGKNFRAVIWKIMELARSACDLDREC